MTDVILETGVQTPFVPLHVFIYMLYNNDKPLLSFHHAVAIFAVNIEHFFSSQLETGDEVEVEEFYVKFKGL